MRKKEKAARWEIVDARLDALEQPVVPLAGPVVEHIIQFFDYGHLPEDLQQISRPFQELAQSIVVRLPRNPERTVALRKLLEAKDAAVRAMIAN